MQTKHDFQLKGLPPGSNEAIEAGCQCPILDNCHGKGGYNLPEGLFWINEHCPLHGIKK